MKSKEHWEQVYKTKSTDSVSWFQEHALRSQLLIRQTGVSLSAPIIDVGGEASTLVDDLLADGYSHLTVLDLSSAAIAVTKNRLGSVLSQKVQWLEADIMDVELAPQAYEVWHDRAVFHFFTAKEDRQNMFRLRLKRSSQVVTSSLPPLPQMGRTSAAGFQQCAIVQMNYMLNLVSRSRLSSTRKNHIKHRPV